MNKQQSEFNHLKKRLLSAREQLQAESPNWGSIPLYKKPTVALEFAEKQAELAQQVAEDTISIVMNIDARLRAGGL